jgi:hypothetical protein
MRADDGSNGDYFGYSVGVSDDKTIVVGTFGNVSNRGSVYTFQKHACDWTQIKINLDVVLISMIVAVGAYYDDEYKGSVYLNKLT